MRLRVRNGRRPQVAPASRASQPPPAGAGWSAGDGSFWGGEQSPGYWHPPPHAPTSALLCAGGIPARTQPRLRDPSLFQARRSFSIRVNVGFLKKILTCVNIYCTIRHTRNESTETGGRSGHRGSRGARAALLPAFSRSASESAGRPCGKFPGARRGGRRRRRRSGRANLAPPSLSPPPQCLSARPRATPSGGGCGGRRPASPPRACSSARPATTT